MGTTLSDIRRFNLQHDLTGALRVATQPNALYVPDDNGLRLRFVVLAHFAVACHRGVDSTLAFLTPHVWWPHMRQFVGSFVQSCITCAKCDGTERVLRPQLHTVTPQLTGPGQAISFDYCQIRAPDVGDHSAPVYVLVVIDLFSRFVSLYPAQRADAETTATLLLQYFASYTVVPAWYSDRGSHFKNKVMEIVEERLGARHHFVTPHAPWANGAVEQVNRHVRKLLSAVMLQHRAPDHAWPQYLPIVAHCINHTPSTVLDGLTPALVFLGRQSTNPVELVASGTGLRQVSLQVGDVKQALRALQLARDALTERVKAIIPREQRVRGGEKPVDFGVGDYVLVSALALIPNAPVDKTRPKWLGPFQCVGQINALVFQVFDLVTRETSEVHATFIKRYADASLQVTPELLDVMARGSRGFVPRSVLQHRFCSDGQVQLLVMWEPDGDLTWEPFLRFKRDASRKVSVYLKKLPQAVRDEIESRAAALV